MAAELWWAFGFGLLTPVAMMACHPVFVHVSRRPPNPWSGYRTPRASASQEAWATAQLLCARMWLRWGAGLTVLTVAGFAALYAGGNRDADTWWWTALVFAFVPLTGSGRTVVVVERRLRALEGARRPGS